MILLCTAMDINSSWLRMALLGMLQLKTFQNNSADRMRLFIIKSIFDFSLFSVTHAYLSPNDREYTKSPITNCIYYQPGSSCFSSDNTPLNTVSLPSNRFYLQKKFYSSGYDEQSGSLGPGSFTSHAGRQSPSQTTKAFF